MEPVARHAVVGVDGSPASLEALSWATAATGSGGRVHVVHVVGAAADRPGGEGFLVRALADAGLSGTPADVQVGDVAEQLARAADDVAADVIVVGMHAQRRRVLRSLGPVVSELLRTASRPVAIAGEPLTGSATPRSGAVVAGVGHGPATTTAVHWAAAYAVAHDCALHLIRAVRHRPVFRDDGLLDVVAYYVDPSLVHEWAMADVEALALELDRAADGGITITWSTPRGSPGPVLVEAGSSADLLVIGLHDRPGDNGAGSDHDVPGWLRHALLAAPCPVVAVPAATPG